MEKHGFTPRARGLLSAAGMLIGAVLAGAAPLPAAAQQSTPNPEQACRDDAFRLCNDLIPDRDKVGACLRKNARRLSHDCHTVIFGETSTRHRATYHRTYRRHIHHH